MIQEKREAFFMGKLPPQTIGAKEETHRGVPALARGVIREACAVQCSNARCGARLRRWKSFATQLGKEMPTPASSVESDKWQVKVEKWPAGALDGGCAGAARG